MLRTISPKFLSIPLLFLVVSHLVHADVFSCEQQQSMCRSKCELLNPTDDSAMGACKANCVGRRVNCTVSEDAGKVKSSLEKTEKVVHKSLGDASDKAANTGENLGDKVEGFWDGLTEE